MTRTSRDAATDMAPDHKRFAAAAFAEFRAGAMRA
jgi:hypothetical protein